MAKFTPLAGNLTNKIRYEYLELCVKQKKISPEIYNNNKIKKIIYKDYYIKEKETSKIFENNEITGLYASSDLSKTLYFWQIYSIIGPEPIKKLITVFYTSIFNSTTDLWFKEEFEDLGPLKHHIDRQTEFWLDVMGGGPLYKANMKKLHMKHKLVENIMTEKGANKWMYFMINAINIIKEDLCVDRRIIPCLIDFLNFFMLKYAHEFDFNFYEIKDLSLKSKL
jgi:truncated hemoglobin YjbI